MATWVGLHRSQPKVFSKSEVNIIVAKAARTSYYHQFFIDNLTLLWPWDYFIIWSERNYRKTAKTRYFQLFSVDLTLQWPLDDLAMILGYPKVMAMPNANAKKTLQPLCYPCNFSGWFGKGLCWDLDMFQAIIYISSKQNVAKTTKISYFQPFWVDFTSLWPWNDLTMTLWELPCGIKHQPKSPCVLGLGFKRVIWSAGPTIYSQPFWADLTLLWPWDDLTKTLG